MLFPFCSWAWRLRWWRLAGMAACTSAFVACSGGGNPTTLEAAQAAPRIVEPPADQTVSPGGDANFAVRVDGSPPLTFQWQRNGVDIDGAKAPAYTVAAATESDAGSRYRVVVRNAGGEAVSSEATLRVEGAKPSVLRILRLGVVSPGQPLQITVTLAGNPPFQYQWLRNGEPIADASGTSDDVDLTLGPLPLTVADDGVRFAVEVANAQGVARSSEAIISVVGRQRLAAGASHSLAASADGGAVWAWGSNANGQLGDGTSAARPTPIVVPGLAGVVALAAGADHSLALTADGTVWAWGRNASGALGDGTQIDRFVPQRVPGLDRVVDIAAGGGRSFAVRADGSVWAWGENSTGALGIGTLTDALEPTRVGAGTVGFAGIVRVAAGARSTLALRIDGRVFQFGAVIPTSPVTTGPQVRPAIVDGLINVASIAAGDRLSIALDVNGALWSWGLNGRGQLGLGNTSLRSMPNRIERRADGAPMPPALRVAAGGEFAVALAVDGSLLAWGAGSSGQLGTGDLLDRSAPLPAATLPLPVRAIAAGGSHGLAELADGSLAAFGANESGQLGLATIGAAVDTPIPVPRLDLD